MVPKGYPYHWPTPPFLDRNFQSAFWHFWIKSLVPWDPSMIKMVHSLGNVGMRIAIQYLYQLNMDIIGVYYKLYNIYIYIFYLDIFQFGHVLGLPPSNHWAEALETQLQPSAGSLTHLLQAGMGPVAGALFFFVVVVVVVCNNIIKLFKRSQSKWLWAIKFQPHFQPVVLAMAFQRFLQLCFSPSWLGHDW